MAKSKRWLEDKAAELGSVELAYDAYEGIGAYNQLKWSAENGDEQSIEFVTMLHDWLGCFISDNNQNNLR